MPARLDTLPQELLDNILSYLPDCTDRAHISNSCKSLHAKTIQSLYKSIHLVWHGNAASTADGEKRRTTRSPRLDILLATLLERPDLASQIDSVNVEAIGFRHGSSGWTKPCLLTAPSKHNVGCVIGVLKRAKFQETKWRPALERNDLDAILALFLWSCPNVSNLRIGIDLVRNNYYLGDILWAILPSPHQDFQQGCRNVHKIAVGTRTDYHRDYADPEKTWVQGLDSKLDWRCYMSFLWFPFLNEAQMNLDDGMTVKAFEMMGHSPTCSQLKRLQLPDSSVRPEILTKVLACTPNLTSLEYEYCMKYNTTLWCENLVRALDHVKNTLEHLKFTMRIMDLTKSVYNYVEGRCQLENFPKLVSLHISPSLLLGWKGDTTLRLGDVLPKSLKAVCLTDDLNMAETFDWFDALVPVCSAFIEEELWKVYTPQLETIFITKPVDDEFLLPEEEAVMIDLCDRNGLKFASDEAVDTS
jgi:hypothetical protein